MAACKSEEPLNLETVTRFAPKLAKLATALLEPNNLDPLQTKHFVYSSSTSTIVALSETMQRLQKPEAGNVFRQLKLDDFEWGEDGQLQARHAYLFPACLFIPMPISYPSIKQTAQAKQRALEIADGQIGFILLEGKVRDRDTLLAAFGRATSDGTRYEGLCRLNGKPLVQVLLATRDANQGLTLLRVQHVHMLEPNPMGWNEVLQATGRAVRRGTHTGLAEEEMRQVTTYIYLSGNSPDVLEYRQAGRCTVDPISATQNHRSQSQPDLTPTESACSSHRQRASSVGAGSAAAERLHP